MGVSSIGRFQFADFIALFLFIPIIIAVIVFFMSETYVLTSDMAIAADVNISYVTDRQYQTAVAFDDLSFLIYGILCIGVILASLSIPVDRDSAPLVFLLFLIFAMFMWMTQDWIVEQFTDIIAKITANPNHIPLVNTPKLAGAITVMPMLSLIISVVIMYLRTTRDVKQ